MRKLLDEIEIGKSTKSGTDWPIVDQLHQTGERQWTITRALCNGIPRATEFYRSEAAARNNFARRLDGRKPRAESAGKPVTLRATKEERFRWEQAAAAIELSLSEWLRVAAEEKLAKGSP